MPLNKRRSAVKEFRRSCLPKILREVLIIFLSGVVAMVIPFSLVTSDAIQSPQLAYALMFWLYAQCYLLLKKLLFKSALVVRVVEFELVSLTLTAYMVILLPVMKDQPEIVQLPACYWTFIFISVYISFRGKRPYTTLQPQGE